jgi:hypothetical protein
MSKAEPAEVRSTEPLARLLIFRVGYCGLINNHDKGEPRELAGEQ